MAEKLPRCGGKRQLLLAESVQKNGPDGSGRKAGRDAKKEGAVSESSDLEIDDPVSRGPTAFCAVIPSSKLIAAGAWSQANYRYRHFSLLSAVRVREHAEFAARPREDPPGALPSDAGAESAGGSG